MPSAKKSVKKQLGPLAVAGLILLVTATCAVLVILTMKQPTQTRSDDMRPIPIAEAQDPTSVPTPEKPSPAPASASSTVRAFIGSPFTIALNQIAMFKDGSTIKLLAIDDSRCNPEVQCIWAGELSAEIRYTDDQGASVYHLGPISNPCEGGIHLDAITETTATFVKGGTCQK